MAEIEGWLARLFGKSRKPSAPNGKLQTPEPGATVFVESDRPAIEQQAPEPGVTIATAAAPPEAAARKAAEDEVAQVWNIGDVILDLYEVTEILGEGGMGTVYKVHHKGWNVDLAVK